jgi:GTP-binding protein
MQTAGAHVAQPGPLTKADAVKESELGARVAEVEAAVAKRPAAFPGVPVTSAEEGSGISELRAAVARLLGERKTSGA